MRSQDLNDGQGDAPDKEFGKLYQIAVKSGVWARLSRTAMAIYGVLTVFAHYTKRTCHLGNTSLAAYAGCHPRNVSSATQELVDRGLIKKWRWENRISYYVYKREDLEINLKNISPQDMDICRKRSRQGAMNTTSRSRSKNGRFESGCSVDKENPSSMDGTIVPGG
jgi:hypothetical protein